MTAFQRLKEMCFQSFHQELQGMHCLGYYPVCRVCAISCLAFAQPFLDLDPARQRCRDRSSKASSFEWSRGNGSYVFISASISTSLYMRERDIYISLLFHFMSFHPSILSIHPPVHSVFLLQLGSHIGTAIFPQHFIIYVYMPCYSLYVYLFVFFKSVALFINLYLHLYLCL